jgi:BirA family biotin operon repressor/biotin-[acetyl-CoA-carboxylase] ligase
MSAMLDLLRGRADYMTEEDLARTAGVSVAEVRLGLVNLRRQGYEIDDHPGLGYRFLAAPDAILEAEIRHGLRTRVIGRNLHCRPVVGSTNDVAAELAAEEAPEGTVVLAEAQTAGRGRQGRPWHSPPGVGIYMTCLLRPSLEATEYWILTACASVAVCRSIRSATGLRAAVKKPNDVLLRGRKVCGILTEARGGVVLLGIGISVNHRPEDFPEELREVATSLRMECGRPVDRIGFLRKVLEELDADYDRLRDDGGKAAVAEWERRAASDGS